jgi:hypothetical protein
MVSREIVGSPQMVDVCWHKDGCYHVMASSHPCPYCQHARWCHWRWWKQVSDWLMSCTLLLIVILAWVWGKLNARTSSTLLMAYCFVHPQLKWWLGLSLLVMRTSPRWTHRCYGLSQVAICPQLSYHATLGFSRHVITVLVITLSYDIKTGRS